jgi:hypothetical protein
MHYIKMELWKYLKRDKQDCSNCCPAGILMDSKRLSGKNFNIENYIKALTELQINCRIYHGQEAKTTFD